MLPPLPPKQLANWTSKNINWSSAILQMESPEAGLKVLAHARNMEYKPATALVTSYRNAPQPQKPSASDPGAHRA